MKKFERIESIITPLVRINVDTDQIIPKQFLKQITRSGFGKNLFHSWRYGDGAKPVESFVLNNPDYVGSQILVTGENFGCGSSREHAVWALQDYGFGAVIAPSFADIFASNCAKNGLLAVKLEPDAVDELAQTSQRVTVDLETKRVSIVGGASWNFEIEDHARRMMLEGLDEISMTLEMSEKITEYERLKNANA